MIPESLAAPARTEDAPVTVLVGGILLALSTAGTAAWLLAVVRSPVPLLAAPLVLLPVLVLLGYEVRVVAAGVDGARATPSFVDWTGLARGGLASACMVVGYLLPGALVAGSALGVGVAVDVGAVAGPPWAVPAGAAVAALAAGGNALAFLYLRPAGLAVYAATGSLAAAFSPGTLLGVATSGRYALGWAVATGGLAVGTLAAGPLALVLVGFPLAFYVRAVVHSVYGRAAATAVVPSSGRPPPPDENPAPAPPEAPPAVQTGRGLPLGEADAAPSAGMADAADAADDDADGPPDGGRDDGGFEWGRTTE
jgi:hypothetical protein